MRESLLSPSNAVEAKGRNEKQQVGGKMTKLTERGKKEIGESRTEDKKRKPIDGDEREIGKLQKEGKERKRARGGYERNRKAQTKGRKRKLTEWRRKMEKATDGVKEEEIKR